MSWLEFSPPAYFAGHELCVPGGGTCIAYFLAQRSRSCAEKREMHVLRLNMRFKGRLESLLRHAWRLSGSGGAADFAMSPACYRGSLRMHLWWLGRPCFSPLCTYVRWQHISARAWVPLRNLTLTSTWICAEKRFCGRAGWRGQHKKK